MLERCRHPRDLSLEGSERSALVLQANGHAKQDADRQRISSCAGNNCVCELCAVPLGRLWMAVDDGEVMMTCLSPSAQSQENDRLAAGCQTAKGVDLNLALSRTGTR